MTGAEPLLGHARVRPGQAHLGGLGQIRPMPNKNWKSLFYFQIFSKFQTNLNSIQIWFSMSSTHTIKYKSTSPPIEKYASA
jgi:hypothetical protein